MADVNKLSARNRANVLNRNAKQSAEHAEGKKKHDRKIDKFYDKLAEKIEPIVHAQLRREGQSKKFF